MPDPYLFVFAQTHDEFRVPELLSVAELHGFEITIPPDFDKTRPFIVLELERQEHARLLARRCILVRFVRV
jgi:tRNA (guanine10-N2)-methyltransferase